MFSPGLAKYYLLRRRHVCIAGTFLRNVKIHSKNGSPVYIGRKTLMRNCTITAIGGDSEINIEGGSTNIQNSHLVASSGGKIMIRQGLTTEGCRLKAYEGCTIYIGSDCMFSAGINMSTTDFHSILSIKNNERINQAKDIRIGNHV